MTWKQFWCNHIWKYGNEEDLNREEHQIRVGLTGATHTGRKVNIFARTQTCIKCEITKIVEFEKVKR